MLSYEKLNLNSTVNKLNGKKNLQTSYFCKMITLLQDRGLPLIYQGHATVTLVFIFFFKQS